MPPKRPKNSKINFEILKQKLFLKSERVKVMIVWDENFKNFDFGVH